MEENQKTLDDLIKEQDLLDKLEKNCLNIESKNYWHERGVFKWFLNIADRTFNFSSITTLSLKILPFPFHFQYKIDKQIELNFKFNIEIISKRA